MRSARIKSPRDESAVYHCVTRTVNGEFLFNDKAKEVLRKQLWQAASFCGVQILTYCIMSNHFHVLVRVPEKKELPDKELIRRYRLLYPKVTPFTRQHGGGVLAAKPDESVENVLAAGGVDADKLRASLHKRMGDVSEFMKTVKQRFSVWFNRTHKRYGTLWSERFKSILIEACPRALATVAAYIDLNPVRARLVQDPKDYRFCGYAEAVGEGNERIREGFSMLMESKDWRYVLREYRVAVFGKGSEAKFDGSNAGAIPAEKAAKVLNEGGRLPVSVALRCRVRYFSDGAVLGSQVFVAEALKKYQKLTGRRRKQTGPRPLPGADWSGLTTLRGLRNAPFGSTSS
jgi:putative transposase